MYRETVASAVALWSKDPFAHGYVVVPVALYLAWERRDRLTALRPRPAFWAVPVLGLLAFLWLLGNLTGTAVIQQICLLAMIAGFVWGVFGSAAARVLVFPMAFIVFALPLGDRLVPVLQDLTARFAVKMLSLSGVPVLLQGHVISIPGSSWQVAQACSGINYLTSSLAIGYLYAGTAYRYWGHRIGFLVASALVPLIANGVRVYTTILIASHGGTGIVAGMEHYLYGWLVFTVIMGLLFATCGRWSEGPPEPAPASGGDPPVRAASRWSPVVVAALGVLVAGIAPLSARSVWLPTAAADQVALRARAPRVSLPWTATDQKDYAWAPHFVTPNSEFLQAYDSGSHLVKLYVAYYAASQPDVKLATAGNVLFADPWWAAGTTRRRVVQESQTFTVSETRLEGPSSSLIVWTWYRIDGKSTGNDYMAKLLLAKARLLRSPTPSAAIAIATEYRPELETEQVLGDFLANLNLSE
jgi:exosortase A